MVQAKQYREDLYFLEDERVRQFLLLGPQEALLLDTGFPDSHIGRLVEELAGGRPVRVAMTHGDPDHTGGLGTFGECWMHRGDWPMVDSGLQLHPLAEGDVLTCGGWRLEVIEIPGHTPGSVAFFDPARRLLFPGDSVQQGGPIYLFGSHRNLDRYIWPGRPGWTCFCPATTAAPSAPTISPKTWRMPKPCGQASCRGKNTRPCPAPPTRAAGPRFITQNNP